MVNAYQNALRYLWTGKCTVTVREAVTDPVTKITGFEEVVQYMDEPCRLSFGSSPATAGGVAASVDQSIKLFLAPNVKVPPGSKITVTQNNFTGEYEQSSEPCVYTQHQEIALQKFSGWA